MADPKEITVDFMFGLGGKAGDAIFKPVQDALLDAFRRAISTTWRPASLFPFKWSRSPVLVL